MIAALRGSARRVFKGIQRGGDRLPVSRCHSRRSDCYTICFYLEVVRFMDMMMDMDMDVPRHVLWFPNNCSTLGVHTMATNGPNHVDVLSDVHII